MVESPDPPDAVLFDLDNTLCDRDHAVERLLQTEVLCPTQRAELRRLDASGLGDRTALFTAWTRCTGQPMNQQLWTQGVCAGLTPDQELLSGLRALSCRLKMAVVSNGGTATQRAKIQAAGLDAIFSSERIYISAELGWSKPDPSIFSYVCRDLAVRPSRTLMVGDRADIDGVGARAAGLGFLQVVAL